MQIEYLTFVIQNCSPLALLTSDYIPEIETLSTELVLQLQGSVAVLKHDNAEFKIPSIN